MDRGETVRHLRPHLLPRLTIVSVAAPAGRHGSAVPGLDTGQRGGQLQLRGREPGRQLQPARSGPRGQ